MVTAFLVGAALPWSPRPLSCTLTSLPWTGGQGGPNADSRTDISAGEEEAAVETGQGGHMENGLHSAVPRRVRREQASQRREGHEAALTQQDAEDTSADGPQVSFLRSRG